MLQRVRRCFVYRYDSRSYFKFRRHHRRSEPSGRHLRWLRRHSWVCQQAERTHELHHAPVMQPDRCSHVFCGHKVGCSSGAGTPSPVATGATVADITAAGRYWRVRAVRGLARPKIRGLRDQRARGENRLRRRLRHLRRSVVLRRHTDYTTRILRSDTGVERQRHG